MVLSEIKRILSPLYQGVIHVFKPPLTIKYPYAKPQNIPEEYFRYDPKLGVALPGYKGRHILYLDKCTGCNLCDIACLNIAEAITMVYGFNVVLSFDRPFHDALKKSDPDALSLINSFASSVQMDIKQTSQDKQGSSLFADPFQIDTKLLAEKEGRLELKLNLDPIYRDRALSVYEEKIEGTVQKLLSGGWQLSQQEVKDGDRDSEFYSLTKKNLAASLGIVKIDEDMAHNKKSIFPMVDYGRCVFCGFCVEPETIVISNPGIKQISEINVGDQILTHRGEYRPVTRIWDLTYSGLMFRIRSLGRPDPLVCTADHPILAVRRPVSNRKDGRLLREKGPLEFVLPTELKRGDYLVTPIVKRVSHTSEYHKDIPMYKNGCVIHRLKVPAEASLFRLIGYYLAEGYCDGGRTVNFAFGSYEKELIDDCKSLLKRYFGKEPKEEKNTGRGVGVVIHSAVAEDFFAEFGKGAPNKRVTDWVFFAEPRKQAELLRGLWRGDGCLVKQPRQQYFNIKTTSKTLAYQTQMILGRLGLVSTIEVQERKDRLPAYSVNIFGTYSIRFAEVCGIPFNYRRTKTSDKFFITDDYVYSPITSIEAAPVQNHRVMDVTVADDHTFVPAGIVTSNCVDACPFYALEMTGEYELSAYSRESLLYDPKMLAEPPLKHEKRV